MLFHPGNAPETPSVDHLLKQGRSGLRLDQGEMIRQMGLEAA